MMTTTKRTTIGDLLLNLKAIDELQLRAMIGHQKRWGLPLGRIAVESGFCSWKHVLLALSIQSGVPAVDLDKHRPDPKLADLVTEKLARKHKAIPLALRGEREDTLVVAIAAPASLAALDELAQVSRKKVKAYLAADHALEQGIDEVYGGVRKPNRHEPARAQAPLQEQEFELGAA